VQLAVIIAAARGGAWLLGKLGQPQVVGEIAAGLLLGPSFLGRISPEISQFIFPTNPDVSLVFRVMSEIGLVFLMFLIGLEFDFTHLRDIGKTAARVAVAGIVLPFALGIVLAWRMHPHLAADVNRTGFMLFVAVALSITAIPVLGRIMVEFQIQRTPLGTLTITAAAVDDALGWILLAAVSAIVGGGFQIASVATMLTLTVGFVLASWFVLRPLLSPWVRRMTNTEDRQLSLGSLSAVMIVTLVAAAITNVIGIFSIFGPFILGASLSHEHEFRDAVVRRLRDFVYAFFLPIFFTYTGLRTNVGLLDSSLAWMFCGLVLLTAMAGKMVGCGLAARSGGSSWRESGCIAVMMNTRALMGLIAINVGRELGVVPDSVFCMLVIMALATTFLTSPVLRRLLPEMAAARAENTPQQAAPTVGVVMEEDRAQIRDADQPE
jgi:Kef-type K+ transport system membrane component KefB